MLPLLALFLVGVSAIGPSQIDDLLNSLSQMRYQGNGGEGSIMDPHEMRLHRVALMEELTRVRTEFESMSSALKSKEQDLQQMKSVVQTMHNLGSQSVFAMPSSKKADKAEMHVFSGCKLMNTIDDAVDIVNDPRA